jgi:type I restriction enzyme S subunit
MEVMSGYKQSEVGVIPQNWEVSRLKELVTIKSGFAFSSSHFSDTGPILLTPGNFKLEGGLYFNERNIKHYSGPYSSMMHFDYGDLLLVMTDLSPDCNLLGKPAFVHLQERILHNQRIGKIIVNSNRVSPEFLYRFFLSDTHSRRMKETATGSTVRHTSNGSIYNSLIPLPPKSEQEAIVAALSDTDALIESLEQLVVKKRHVKQGAMQELLLPKKGWTIKHLGEIAHIKNGSRNNQDKVEDGKYPFFVRSATVERINTFSYECEAILIPGEGGIGSIFHYVDGRFEAHQRVYVIRQFAEQTCGKYIYFSMVQNFGHHAMEHSVKATVDSLRMPTFLNFEMSLPPSYDEQKEIVNILSDMDDELAALEANLDKYRQLKHGMMHDLLTGRIRLV